MANPWFRFYAEFAHDAKVQTMPEHMQRRLVMLFCLRSGNVTETLNETELAFALHISPAELAETKALFLQKGFIDERFDVLNWGKRQFASDSSTARTRAYRDRQKQDGNDAGTSPKRSRDALDTDTETDSDTETDKSKESRRSKATRLPDSWEPSVDDLAFCQAERPDLDPRTTAERFRDYWISQAGAKGRKLNWSATWRNWVRNERGPAARAAPRYESEKDRKRRETIAYLTGENRRNEPSEPFTIDAG